MDRTTVSSILKDTKYNISLFSNNEISNLEKNIKLIKNKPCINCIIREKTIQLKPEEIIRQLYTKKLISEFNYPKNRIRFEHPIKFGRETKSADIVIFDKDRPTTEYIIVEVKKPKLKEGKDQLKSYCNATGAPIGVWTNGGQITHYNRKDPNYFEDITNIPNEDQTLEDVIKERFTWLSLVTKDRLLTDKITLKTKIQDMENEVLANAGVDVFEEVFKLIFTKLYDETKSRDDKNFIDRTLKKELKFGNKNDINKIKKVLKNIDDDDFRILEFRNTGQTDAKLKEKIQRLFDEAKKKWQGIFPPESRIDLTDSHLSICVSSLQNIKLFNTNLQIIDEAFEYLVSKDSKAEKGQFFTPRYVIDMCVKMLNPKKGESMIDTASGSSGFTVHTIFHILGHLFQNSETSSEEKETISKVFAIDFDEKLVRVARTLNLIAGDGEINVLYLNTLDYGRWNEKINDPDWRDTYGKGFKRFEALKTEKKSYKNFNFDVLMANPPFAGDIKESSIIHKYELGFNKNKKPKTQVGRDILFIERNLDFVKPGGRLALVLPQGRFSNKDDRIIRDYISEKARIISVVSVHVNTFKPHTTGTKTSILLLQKWDKKLCPKKDDYNIFFAVSEKPGKDNSGEYIYVKNENGEPKLDKYGHLIVDHDLHNHSGELKNGIAEEFLDWAKKEKLSFL